ncbi:MAG: lactate dehydrogenase [Gammaproteobacteria bacterium]|nr:lactate dehydrogenase [Gammaproteobacteria bacterium]MDE0258480.1 lactate dehydrogenase [Gammaproteobacteria bacterium]
MNAVEIEEAVSALSASPFDPAEFPFAFLEAFGNKKTTIKRLRAGTTNRSDIGGVLQRSHIHMKIAPPGETPAALDALRASPETARAKAKFVLATDGREFHAEDLESGDIVVSEYADLHEHFGFFLPLAGITTVKQIRESAFDIKATGRLNRLYLELLKENPDWEAPSRRHEMNHFMARLIFCFFAEDTDIFPDQASFTDTLAQMSDPDGSNTHDVLDELFRAMKTPVRDRAAARPPGWAARFPYVNGGLFSDSTEAPRFSRIARSYLLHIGNLDWTKINPDIFGSMIQAVAVEEERGNLGMHYTSVPNILKVLNPLFLDDLREKLEAAGDNGRKLLSLRKRMARIRVFDPACGSGNFLVIAYKEMRAIEAEINRRRGESERRSAIPISNFRGIEIGDFSAEIARLALVIAEYQCNVNYLGQKEAAAVVLPLDKANWITCANALRLDWSRVCPPTGTGVKLVSDDLFHTPLNQAEIDFENEGGETFICGNPPYLGSQGQTAQQKADLESVFEGRTKRWKSLDYVAGWFMKAADYGAQTPAASAFVATNSVCQGRQVATLWPLVSGTGHSIAFAHTSFKWANLASHNAGVTVVIVGLSNRPGSVRRLYADGTDGEATVRTTGNISPYLVPGPDVLVRPRRKPLAQLPKMSFGNMPNDDGNLLLDRPDSEEAIRRHGVNLRFIRSFVGSQEFIRGSERRCIWVTDEGLSEATENEWLAARFEAVRAKRAASDRETTRQLADSPHRFGEVRQSGSETAIVVPRHSSEGRRYLPVGYIADGTIIGDSAAAIFDAPLWHLALIASRLHLVWIATVCGKLETRYRYSNTLGWNTFPVPMLTENNRRDLTACAENILLAREAHFPATIAALYAADSMPENLQAAHERNDEVLERIYIGRRFRNDSERLEKLFALYTNMAN